MEERQKAIMTQEVKRGWYIPVKMLVQTKELGLSIDQVKDMLTQSARITHPEANRRFGDYLFLVEGDRLSAIITPQGKKVSAPTPAPVAPAPAPEPTFPAVERRRNPPVAPPASLLPPPTVRCVVCSDSGRVTVFNECEACEGQGCAVCRGTGEIPATIPCQDCPPPPEKTGVYRRK